MVLECKSASAKDDIEASVARHCARHYARHCVIRLVVVTHVNEGMVATNRTARLPAHSPPPCAPHRCRLERPGGESRETFARTRE